MTLDRWLGDLLRAGRNEPQDVLTDALWLAFLVLLLIATGIGLRDPWPADEPRFALIAHDMVRHGDWLLPRVGGEPYADKPPLYFWLMALFFQATQSLRTAFLLPSLFAAAGCVALVYDLGRRLWNRETGLVAALALLSTVQFVWQARQAQIDATLCFWTTLSLYALLRHLLLGPAWGWYTLGWAAAGLGVITKGVGFLPLLVLLPFAMLRDPRWAPRMTSGQRARWLLGPLALVLAVGVWLVPMLLAARSDPAFAAYRDEILFGQTMTRYTNAWHHREPFWYFIVEVIPWLWLPLTLLTPWLLRQWRRALRSFDLRTALLGAWVVLVVLFFSFSTGKRGVYVLPAVPALALLCAPHLVEVASRRAAQRAMFLLALVPSIVCGLAAAHLIARPSERADVLALYDVDLLAPLLAIGVAAALCCAIMRPRRGFLAYGAVLAIVLLIVSFWLNPAMNAARSGARFMARVEQAADPQSEFGLIAYREQYLLTARREVVHFGHARWRDADREMADAALWLASSPGRQLLINEPARVQCFARAKAEPLGRANRKQWYLVRDGANPACVAAGSPRAARAYSPPALAAGTLRSN